jgi:purine catabolism regulator
MTLTIAQALHELPILSKAQVVAGASGVERTIRWTHIIDHPDVVPWVQEGHLLLTTAFAIMLHPELQADLVRALDEKRLAGMIINIGRYMLEIPAEMIAAADACGFPLITLPWDVDFTAVTHAIHEHILQEQYALSEQADAIHQALTRIVLEGGDLARLTRQLAEILHCSVTIEDESLRLLAHTTLEPTDEVRARSIQLGRTPDEVVAALRRQGVFEHLRQHPAPYHLPPNAETGFTLERIVAPILVGETLFGYIWIIASDQPLTRLDTLVIERGAVVAALILSRQEAIYENEQRLKTQLFEGLCDPDAAIPLDGLPEATWRAGRHAGYTLLVLDAGGMDRQSRRRLTALVEAHMRREGLPATAIERGHRLAVVLGTLDVEKVRQAAGRLLPVAAAQGFQLTAGISAASREAEALRQHYQQAVDTLSAAAALDQRQRRVWAYDDLGFLGDLLIRPAQPRSPNRYTATLEKIAHHDAEKNTHYLHTLETYLDHLSSANQAAQALYIHRNTLYQRLARLTDLWGIDFDDPLVMLNLNLAIKDWHLNHPQ